MALIRSHILFALTLLWSCKSGDCDNCERNITRLDNCIVQAICTSERYEARYTNCYNDEEKHIVTFANICIEDPRDTIIDINDQSQHVKEINVIDSACTTIPKVRFYNGPGVEDFNLHRNKIETIIMKEIDLGSLIVLDVSNNMISTIIGSFSEYPSLKKINASFNLIEHLDKNSFARFISLEILDLASNILMEIDDTFSSLSQLEEIYLDFNQITDIKKEYFENNQNLKILSLSNNKIKDVNDAFLSLTQLQVINLSFNQLSDIKKDSFVKLENLKVLTMNNNYIKNVEWFFLNLMPLLVKFDISYNKINTLDKKSFRNNTVLEYVDISNNSLSKLYPNTFLNKNLYFFSIKDNILQGRLERGMFAGMTLISELDLSYQNIDTVSEYAFYGLNNLAKLLLNNNKINALQKHSFDSLFALEILDLSNNLIHNIDFQKKDLIKLRDFDIKNNVIDHLGTSSFFETQSLRYLDLSQNNITSLEKDTFAFLHEVVTLDLSNNAIAGSLEAGTFKGLESIPSLDLSYTLINIIMNNSFVGLLEMNKLNISHSAVHELQYNAFCELSELKSLDLSYNKLTVLNVNFFCIENLQNLSLKDNFLNTLGPILLHNLIKLDISFNKLIIMEDTTFEKLETLSELNLSHNNNLTFTFNLIKHLKKLSSLSLAGLALDGTSSKYENQEMVKKLDLSDSNIINITNYIKLEAFFNCDDLNLSGNKIPYIKYGTISKNTKIRILNLSFNEILFLQPGSFKDNSEIEVLNVAHNKLFQLDYGTFKGLWRLSYLDISFNNIGTLNRGVFDDLSSLATLIADSNDIKTVDYNDFREVSSLTKLSIGSNPISCLILKDFEKFNTRISLTALNHEDLISNHKNISCKSDNNKIISDGKNNEILFNNNTFERQEKLLGDIKDLVKAVATKENSYNNNLNENSNVSKNWFSLAQNMNGKLLAKIDDDSKIFTESLNKIIRNFNFTLARLKFNPNGLISENKTSDNMLNYLLQDLNDKIDNFDKRITEIEKEKTRSAAKVNLSKSDDLENSPLLSKKPVKQEIKASSVFQNICLGFIAIVILCLVLQKIYKSDLFVPVRRSISTRRINEAMEADNL